ncbi:conserved hypothetical protein [Leishmania major strain Friedlin]|uniref:Uncharacterized protein n=1 Tax=Leishmania major TaxID=5664 RepID=E9AEP2_LEIMA|nr:conserved hypothetical protein [Leishmania major strain Friedlin]CAG9582418.1 hypothetical_protein_-_conserved [Leishmania major strain Friedlin]CBZ12695.1 conserved hypothetical protein [Leishmania major strain Friedlin]|eukprot:XP_003722462.1 conserved hypothetical protein [Leishmania major strain Friedlin]
MPPKKKGHTLVGRQKVFRHAVEHVRLGLGHTVLGNLSLGLAASSTTAAEGSSTAGRPAFYVELNEQLLSHTSKDFKRFRWEVLELCETNSLFQLNHRQLAQKLLACLIDRRTHRVDATTDEAAGTKETTKPASVQRQHGDGSTTQAYEAFARLTIAFVRDMGSKFLPYFQIFQQAVQAGMYDHYGNLIVDTARLQLVFAVQAAWCRELRECWADPAHAALVRRVIRQYVAQLHDTKEYVRRLSAELLAFLCRLSRPLLPLVVEEACGDVLRSYEETATAAAAVERDWDGTSSRGSASECDGNDGVGEEESNDSQNSVEAAPSTSIWANGAQLLDFVRTTLPHHPVVDGLAYFIGELFRGVRGSLSSSFETHYVRLLHAFQLLTRQSGDWDEERSPVDVVRLLHQLRHPLVPFLDAVSEEDEEDAAVQHKKMRRYADLHSTRWSVVFGLPNHGEEGEEGATVLSGSDVQGAQHLLRSIGSLALGNATATVLRETKKQSVFLQPDSSEEDELDDGASAETAPSPFAASAVKSATMRPSHRILAAAVLSIDSTYLSPSWPHYIDFLAAMMGSVNFALWVDSRESALLQRLAAQLLAALRHPPSSASSGTRDARTHGAADATYLLEVAAAALGLLSPLCLSPCLGSSAGAGADASSHLLQLQQWFVPVAKAAVQVCVKAATKAPPHVAQCHRCEQAQQILFAFAQDVLQKNYAFALEQERRMAEEADARDLAGGEGGAHRVGSTAGLHDTREDAYMSEEEDDADGTEAGGAYAVKRAQHRSEHLRIPSYLTPFALTLLHAIGMALWQGATADVRELRSAVTHTAAPSTSLDDALITALRQSSVRRAVLLSRLLQDHTQHMAVSPLQQLLRLKSMPSTAAKWNNAKGNSAVAATDREVSMRDVLESMTLELLQYYKATQRPAPSSTASEAIAYVSCALPLIQLLVSSALAATPSSTSPVKAALLSLLQNIEAQDQEDAKPSRPAARTAAAAASSLVRATALDPAVYALYAEVAAMLVQLTTGPSARSGTKLLKKALKKRQHASENGVHDDSATRGDEQEGLRHLCRTVAVLVHGFQQLRAATSPRETSGSSSTNNPVDEDTELAAATTALSDETRVQLLHGAEVLLHALLRMFSLDSNSQLYGDDSGTGAAACAQMRGKPALAAESLPAHTRAALCTLRAALPSVLHRAFVQDVLLECLAAPIAGLRLLALRLLRLVCHPSLDMADRLVGAPAVPLDLIDALLSAASFNPLSHTGKLDGMQQELSLLTYQVESGVITQPFHRQLIARTMIGFLYMKFTGAWEIASKVLCSLVAQEQTGLMSVKNLDDDDDDGRNAEAGRDEQGDEETRKGGSSSTSLPTAAQHHKPQRLRRLEPVVWNSVVCVHARALVMGDVVAAGGATSSTETVRLCGDEHVITDNTDDVAAATASCQAQLTRLPCLYGIHLTDQQRHVKGELVSRVFSSTQYSTAAMTLLNSTKTDYEVVQWDQHWMLSQRCMSNSVDAVKAATSRKQQQGTSVTTAALYATSTDRSTLAQTFLSIMEAMVKSSSAIDRKVRLVEDVVLELVAVERNRHPSGVDGSQLRKLDQRLEIAMRACAAAPSGVLTAHQRKHVTAAVQRDIDARSAELQGIFLSYLSEANPRLQRVAVDNLKRLRVEPFNAYHAKLVPYCDSIKNLFAFLSTFHVESDVPAHDVVAYVSAALSLALPKLLTTVSKKKLKEQAVLSRRLMSYLDHLTPSAAVSNNNSSSSPRAAAKDPLAEVFDQLLHRLLSFAMPASTTLASVAADGASAYDFLANVWEDIVYRGCGMSLANEAGGASGCAVGTATVSEPRRRSSHHGIRRLERFLKQLSKALRLLEAMLHAVGQRFSVYVSTCLHVALQAYLVACKQSLRAPVENLLASLTSHEATPQEERARRWAALLNKSLATSALSTSLAHVRRAAMTIVALLFEQFPEDVMDVLRGRSDASVRGGSSAVGHAATAAALPLFTRYLTMLFENSKGTTLDGGSGALVSRAGPGAVAVAAKSSVTPVLRLLTAWVRSPALLPLFSAYPDVAAGTLEEVFAVNHNAASVHRASTQALNEGLRCVSELLSCAEEPVHELPGVPAVVADKKGGVCSSRLPVKATFRHSFLEKHIVRVFTSLYTLLTSGAAREEKEAAAAAMTTVTAAVSRGSGEAVAARTEQRKPSRSGKQTRTASSKGRQSARDRERPTSIMSLSVSMWREVMRTIAQLSRFLHVDSATSTSVSASSLASMMNRLLELALKMVAHPVCMTDAPTTQMVTSIAQALMEQVAEVDYRAHWQPLVRLFNLVANPHARHTLCAMLSLAVTKLALPTSSPSADPPRVEWFRRQLAAAARAVACLNSFENDETFERYDFELRYHTLHSLHDFFVHFGNYGALHRGCTANSSGKGGSGTSAVRKVRAYDGGEDVQLPLDKEHAPVLAAEAMAVLAANVVFFLRDPEQTIRALVLPLLHAMVRYASLGGQRSSGNVALTEQQLAYRTQLLETTLRHEVLASLRRGVVAKDVHIRCAHMQAFEGFGRHFSAEFTSFALLYSPNTEQNFYANVGHVQHRCRLHALAVLRQHAPDMNVRDVLRVFVPFLLSAVKDFAEGKRSQANLTEGRARGYCDAVLLTVSSIAARLPWMAYYRVLSLFLSNANANANLRATMLRGVVQVLSTFHFLDDPAEASAEGAAVHVGDEGEVGEDEVNDVDDAVHAELSAKQREYRHAKVMRVLEVDVLPQLYSYLGDKKASKAISGRGAVNQHSITAVRQEQEREDAASAQAKNALLQLPVAMAITKIVKHFPEDRFHVHVDHLLDELIKKLRTKNDKHRESARRILGAMLQETGPSKLKFVVAKLKDNLVHGYQLHVLGYTLVTLLYQLYEPNSKLLQPSKSSSSAAVAAASDSPARSAPQDPVQEALEGAKKQHRRNSPSSPPSRRQRTEKAADKDGKSGTDTPPAEEVDEDTAVERAEEALLQELGTAMHARFDYRHGMDCLTEVLEDLLLIFLDDYLGEVGVQKEQVEVMSTMVEVKRNRALQGFAFLGKHCDAETVMQAFLHRITWVLTPPSDTAFSAGELHGSARARALLVKEMKSKYVTISKGGSADLIFVNKVRLLAVRVARSIMANPTMSVEKSFEQVRRLLDQHNRTREEKIVAFEAKNGTRRIRGNAHVILHTAERQSRKEQLDQNYLVAPVPERVDVDFSAHTVLATQQKQKLRVYRGRYGKELMEAAKNFYREDPVTAVVLDTLDEFLLKFLLSVLKQVLGIGKEKRYSKAAMKLDMLRHHRARQQEREADGEDGATSGDDEGVEDEEDHVDEAQEAHRERGSEEDEEEEGGAAGTDTVESGENVDGLGTFAEAQAVAEGDAKNATRQARGEAQLAAALLAPGSDLTVTFTREHRGLLESLVPAVLTCLQGEGSDAVVANALDCLLALVSLRPPLDAVNGLQKELFETVTSFIERGSVIKQRAIRLTAAMVAHQKCVISESNAVQLVKLVRAELMERNEYMSVCLSLLYAVLGKHVHIAEIYDLIDIITELLLHWSAHRVIRRRCILILVRFLLEYRLTPEKFKSHIDLYCRNLDYPELTGRTALLELLDTLILRLPAVILREEAPVLLVPLAATVTGSEWVECRRQGGTVLQHLARCAGVDVLVPILSSWMAAAQPRATRSMGVQTWAAIVPALAEFYELDADENGEDDDGDEDAAAAKAQNRAAFQACCAWSVDAVLDGCMFDQLAAACRNKQLHQLSAKSREKVEMKGWAYIFYSLRAAETMLTALPHELYPLLAPRLLPRITEVLILHTHPWVRAVAMRLLRHYLYTYVERHCHYLQEDAWQESACQQADSGTTDDDAMTSKGGGDVAALLFVTEAASTPSKAAVAKTLQTLQAFSSLLKRLLGIVSASDVAMEMYNAHRAIANPVRSELLKVAIYVLRAQVQLALFALTRAAATGRHRYHRDVQQRVRTVYTSLQHQICSLTSPVVQQESLVNYMVRSTTLMQLFGGWASVLPHEVAVNASDGAEPNPAYSVHNAQVRWLTQTQLCPAALLRECVVPLLGLGLRAKSISEKISLIAFQVTGVVVQQLEERRHELAAPLRANASMAKKDDEARLGKKRSRSAAAVAAADDGDEADVATGRVPLDEVLVALKTQLASIHEARRDQQVTQNTKKALKRSRRQMEREERQPMQKSRRPA